MLFVFDIHQLNARVEAAEKAIDQMTKLMTQLAISGALPEEIASKAKDIQSEANAITTDAKDAQMLSAIERPAVCFHLLLDYTCFIPYLYKYIFDNRVRLAEHVVCYIAMSVELLFNV